MPPSPERVIGERQAILILKTRDLPPRCPSVGPVPPAPWPPGFPKTETEKPSPGPALCALVFQMLFRLLCLSQQEHEDKHVLYGDLILVKGHIPPISAPPGATPERSKLSASPGTTRVNLYKLGTAQGPSLSRRRDVSPTVPLVRGLLCAGSPDLL